MIEAAAWHRVDAASGHRWTPPRPDGLHLWRVDRNADESVAAALRPLLDDDERRRAGRFASAGLQRSFVVAHGALRIVLGAYLGLAPHDIRYRVSAHGKPRLARDHGEEDLRFNLSHSGDVAVWAVARGRDVGVDVERVEPNPALADIVDGCFSPAERAAWHALPDEARTAAFYSCWTRKEAYVKARGEGLTRALDSFEVTLAPGRPPALLRSDAGEREPHRWRLLAFVPAPRHVGAVAVEGAVRQPLTFHLGELSLRRGTVLSGSPSGARS